MSKYEFKFIQLQGTRGSSIDNARVEKQLNELGSQGWWALPFKVSDHHLLLMRDAPEPDPEHEESQIEKVRRISRESEARREAERQEAEELTVPVENLVPSDEETEVDEFNGAIINAS